MAKDEKRDRVLAVMSVKNIAVRKMAQAAGFQLQGPSDHQLITALISVTAGALAHA